MDANAEHPAEYAKMRGQVAAFCFCGAHNPMGLYAIYIGKLYAIHGTNANFGIGLRVSQGCIRLRNDDIKYLFDNVPVGTRVQIIDQPVKYTTEPDGSKWLEVHEPLSRNRAEYESDRKTAIAGNPIFAGVYQRQEVDVNRANAALQHRSAMLVEINLLVQDRCFKSVGINKVKSLLESRPFSIWLL
ncbi:L,D-transpeptidase family protein [Escherichia coli]